jgi:8-oxo-dGTP diphosphatase
MSHTYEYPRPAVTTDIILFHKTDTELKVLLIKRNSEPFKDTWALPGGFMNIDETLEQTAKRELKEETGIDVEDLIQFRVFDDPNRDPRGRTISIVFYKFLESIPSRIKAGDDAAEAKWFSVKKLPELAFDHEEVIRLMIND